MNLIFLFILFRLVLLVIYVFSAMKRVTWPFLCTYNIDRYLQHRQDRRNLHLFFKITVSIQIYSAKGSNTWYIEGVVYIYICIIRIYMHICTHRRGSGLSCSALFSNKGMGELQTVGRDPRLASGFLRANPNKLIENGSQRLPKPSPRKHRHRHI